MIFCNDIAWFWYRSIARFLTNILVYNLPILDPHTAKLTKKLLEEEFGWETLEHPPYSPDLAPSDYHIFRSMEHNLRNKKFKDEIGLENDVINFFNSKPVEFYSRGIDLLLEKWQEVIEVDGEYFDY